MSSLTDIRNVQLSLMQKTLKTLQLSLASVDQTTATTLRDPDDGDQGWTVVAVVCHLRDFDHIFHNRAKQMVEENHPMLPAFDHDQMAIDLKYDQQTLTQSVAELAASRAAFHAFFAGLDADQWERAGVHPERGHFSMTDAAIQVVSHDITHLEQIQKILNQASA